MTEVPITFSQSLKYLAADVRERARVEKKQVTKLTFIKAFFNPTLIVLGVYRLQHWLVGHGFSALAEGLHLLNVALFGVDIASRAKIGPGFVLFHANGIYIGPQCQIGKRVYIYHHSSLGVTPLPGAATVSGTLTIGDDVVIASGARVIGSVAVGERTLIAANEAVTTNLPPRTFFRDGKPAR